MRYRLPPRIPGASGRVVILGATGTPCGGRAEVLVCHGDGLGEALGDLGRVYLQGGSLEFGGERGRRGSGTVSE